MTKFEPEIAYRILNDRYERLILEKGNALYRFFAATLDGHWYDELFYSLDETVKFYENEVERLWPVLHYLKTRIAEEKHDAV